MTSPEAFHDHLDRCQQCRDHPFALCQEGAEILHAAAAAASSAALAQAEQGVQKGEAR